MKKVALVLIAIIFSLFTFASVSAQNIAENHTLDTRQKSIVPIAAFTATGNSSDR